MQYIQVAYVAENGRRGMFSEFQLFEYNYNSYRIPYNSIVYIEKVSDNKKCVIYTEDKKSYEINMTITDLVKRLGQNFFRTHKSCIVNLSKIKEIETISIFL